MGNPVARETKAKRHEMKVAEPYCFNDENETVWLSNQFVINVQAANQDSRSVKLSILKINRPLGVTQPLFLF